MVSPFFRENHELCPKLCPRGILSRLPVAGLPVSNPRRSQCYIGQIQILYLDGHKMETNKSCSNLLPLSLLKDLDGNNFIVQLIYSMICFQIQAQTSLIDKI
jgi:hypothetical protein